MSERNFITVHTKIFCIIGHPIKHSMSPIMHNAAIQNLNLDYVYLAFDIKPESLKKVVNSFRTLDFRGINVTIPYKETILKYLDEIDPGAQNIGAINTIKNKNGFLIGRNTDALGFKKALLDSGFDLKGTKVLILGAGGASKAVSFILSQDVESIIIVNRTEKRARKLAKNLLRYSNAEIRGTRMLNSNLKKFMNKTDLLVNTTPVGMEPLINESPIAKEVLHKELFVFDLVYNPIETRLLKYAKEVGCQTLGGINMLIHQAALAFEWWTNKKPNLELMKKKVIENLGRK